MFLSKLLLTTLINRVLRCDEVQKEIRLEVHNTLSTSMITYACGTLVLKKFDKRRLAVAKVKFLKRMAGVGKPKRYGQV